MSEVSLLLVWKYTLAVLSCAVPKRPCRVRERIHRVLSLRQAVLRFREPSLQEKELEGSLQAAVFFAV